MSSPSLLKSLPQNSSSSEPGAPKPGWEIFETGTSNVVADVSKLRSQQAFVESAGDKQERKDVTSLFQASSANTHTSSRVKSRRDRDTSSVARPWTAIPNVKAAEEHDKANKAILSALFSIEKTSCDVAMFEDRITWTPVGPVTKKLSKSSTKTDGSLVDSGVVYIHQISAVRLKNIRNVKAKTVTTIGFAIFTVGSKGQKLREQSTLFLCYSREICIQWATKIKAAILARTDRPTRLLVLSPNIFLSTSAWSSVVEPRLQTVGIKTIHKEFDKGDDVAEYVTKVLSEQSTCHDDDSFQGILVIEKLPFFSTVVRAVLEFKIESLKSGTLHTSLPSLGYIPPSVNNFVGKELHRSADPETAVLHAIYGCIQSIPVCKFYDKNGNFLRYGLTASYGFSGGDTSADAPGSKLGAIQGSLKKSLAFTKAIVQRRSYPCDIHYKDAKQKYDSYDQEELFAEEEFAKFSIVNQHYVDDEDAERKRNENLDGQSSSGSDSGVWPKQDSWDKVERRNYLDVMVTSLPQHFNDVEISEAALSAILVRETMSRKDLFVTMGSQVSLSSNMSKSKPEVLSKTDTVKGTEMIVKPCVEQGSVNTPPSKWCIDETCLDSSIQELHVKIAELPLLMYSRGPDQPLTTGSDVTILRLDTENQDITLDSLA